MINELELKKAEIEQKFEQTRKKAQDLANDIALIEQLLAMKGEYRKTMNDINELMQQHRRVCLDIETEKQTIDETDSINNKEGN